MLSTIFACANGFLSGRFWIGSRMKFSTLYVATRKVCCAWPSGPAKMTAAAAMKHFCNLTISYLAWMMKNSAAWSALALKEPALSSNFNFFPTGVYGPDTELLDRTV